MRRRLALVTGQAARAVARLRGGGSALPGLIAERIDPTLLARLLSGLPMGVVVVTGTNGKTTTTKMITELLTAQGLTVLTNPSGSNFSRGILSELLAPGTVDMRTMRLAGRPDIGVFELDEGHAVLFAQAVPPRHCVLLNVMRDQLDRFGEVDGTARLLATVAAATTEWVVVNRDDPYTAAIAREVAGPRVASFGVDPNLRLRFPSDAELYGRDAGLLPGRAPDVGMSVTELRRLDETGATFAWDNAETRPVHLRALGHHNALNAAAAIAAVRAVLVEARPDTARLIDALSRIEPAFGRGETVDLNGCPLEIVLVKNPAGFRIALASYAASPVPTMLAINNNEADGRDVSWLWDVPFGSLRDRGVSVVSGMRAYDMALRLQYEDIDVTYVSPDLRDGLRLLDQVGAGPKRVFATYTAMIKLRRSLVGTPPLEVAA